MQLIVENTNLGHFRYKNSWIYPLLRNKVRKILTNPTMTMRSKIRPLLLSHLHIQQITTTGEVSSLAARMANSNVNYDVATLETGSSKTTHSSSSHEYVYLFQLTFQRHPSLQCLAGFNKFVENESTQCTGFSLCFRLSHQLTSHSRLIYFVRLAVIAHDWSFRINSLSGPSFLSSRLLAQHISHPTE